MQRTESRRISTRSFLKAALAYGFLGSGCRGARQDQTSVSVRSDKLLPANFTPVDVSPERKLVTVVGHRPVRSSGFRVEAEIRNGRALVHNYGHGGSGVSLSWGSSALAIEEGFKVLPQMPPLNDGCAVIGGGAVGLSNALLMQRRGWKTTIYAKDFHPHTTSSVAGALWDPFEVPEPGNERPGFKTRFSRAAEISYEHFKGLVSNKMGVHWLNSYMLFRKKPSWIFPKGIEHLFLPSRELASNEHPFRYDTAWVYRAMMIETSRYLPALFEEFRSGGGQIVKREFDNLAEVLSLKEPVIFNCTGSGAKSLVNDDELIPTRCQLTILKPQHTVNYAVGDEEIYMFPRHDGILLGGATPVPNDLSAEPDLVQERKVLAAHKKLFEWGDGMMQPRI